MAIIIANDGDKVVQTIGDRNAITRKFDGMQVVVRDATADALLGSGSACYVWDALSAKWVVSWAEAMPTTSFKTETRPIVGSTVTTSNIPNGGVVWSAVVIDETNKIVGDANIVSVSMDTITLFDASSDGLRLRFTYAFGSIAQQVSQVLEGSAGVDRVARAMAFL